MGRGIDCCCRSTRPRAPCAPLLLTCTAQEVVASAVAYAKRDDTPPPRERERLRQLGRETVLPRLSQRSAPARLAFRLRQRGEDVCGKLDVHASNPRARAGWRSTTSAAESFVQSRLRRTRSEKYNFRQSIMGSYTVNELPAGVTTHQVRDLAQTLTGKPVVLAQAGRLHLLPPLGHLRAEYNNDDGGPPQPLMELVMCSDAFRCAVADKMFGFFGGTVTFKDEDGTSAYRPAVTHPAVPGRLTFEDFVRGNMVSAHKLSEVALRTEFVNHVEAA